MRLVVLLCSSGFAAGLLVSTARLSRRLARHCAVLSTECGAGTAESPRIARDSAWAAAIAEAWRSDEDIDTSLARGDIHRRETATYHDEGGGAFHGEVVWAEGPGLGAVRSGVVLVHTAVGPRDMMLQWRAQSLAALGHVVLIADLLGDATGAGWEAEWAAPRRALLVADRDLSRRRMRLALDTLSKGAVAGAGTRSAAPKVDPARVAAVGYCFGGRCVLDLARGGGTAGVCGVVSLHGVLDAEPLAAGVTRIEAAVLLCHGDADPFTTPASLDACVAQLRAAGAQWRLHTYGGAPHAWTNPAQRLNSKSGFGYDRAAAEASWQATTAFLAEVLR